MYHCMYVYIYIYITKARLFLVLVSTKRPTSKIQENVLCYCALRTQVTNKQNIENQSSYFGQERLKYRRCSVKYVTALKNALDTEGKLVACITVRKKEPCRERKKHFIRSYVQQGYTDKNEQLVVQCDK